jgi:hypothetical protein
MLKSVEALKMRSLILQTKKNYTLGSWGYSGSYPVMVVVIVVMQEAITRTGSNEQLFSITKRCKKQIVHG